MKPYRVKRGSKFIGSFIVVHDGVRVNLGTKDANEARRRAALVVKGKWPETTNAAAVAVKDALEGREPEENGKLPEAVEPVEPVRSDPVPPGASAGVVPPVDGAGVDVDPVGPSAQPVVPPAADAVNAAAAAEDALLADVKSELAAQGFDLAEIKAEMPKYLSGAHLWIQGQMCRGAIRVFKGKMPPMVVIPEADPMRVLLGKLDAVFLSRLDLDVEEIGPGWMLVILSAVLALAQVGGMFVAMAEEEKAAALKGTN